MWLALVLAVAWGYVALEGDRALARGRRRYLYRHSLARQLRDALRARPEVVWLGDSTILGVRDRSYPQIVRGAVAKTPSAVIGYLGCDFFTYYPVVAGLLAEHRPAVLVMVAHLRLFGARGSRNDLASLIPNEGIPHAARLPFATRSLTLPRLLLTRVLRWDAGEQALYVFEGGRVHVADVAMPWLGPKKFAPPSGGLRELGVALAASDVEVGPNHPTVRMMAGTITLARDSGVHVVIVGTPIPFEAMRNSVGYDPVVYARRFAVLRRAAEAAGAVYVDLHEALPMERFRDAVGHFDEAGATLLADRLRPVVIRELSRARWERWRAVAQGAERAR